jgi:hypothetical protein
MSDLTHVDKAKELLERDEVRGALVHAVLAEARAAREVENTLRVLVVKAIDRLTSAVYAGLGLVELEVWASPGADELPRTVNPAHVESMRPVKAWTTEVRMVSGEVFEAVGSVESVSAKLRSN